MAGPERVESNSLPGCLFPHLGRPSAAACVEGFSWGGCRPRTNDVSSGGVPTSLLACAATTLIKLDDVYRVQQSREIFKRGTEQETEICVVIRVRLEYILKSREKVQKAPKPIMPEPLHDPHICDFCELQHR